MDCDALLAGGRVSVASEVKGDLVVAGGVSLGGAVDDDLYAAGGTLQLDAIVSGNARVAGGEVTVGPATVVAGALTLSGGRVQFEGNSHGYLSASGGSVRVNGEVHGDVEVRAEELEIGPDTRIGGRLVYRGPVAPVVPEGAVIAGGVEFHEQGARHWIDESKPRVLEARHGVGSVAWLVGVFIAASLCLLLFPRFLGEAGATVGRRPWQSLGLGLAILVCVPFVGVVLLITNIGIPLALLVPRARTQRAGPHAGPPRAPGAPILTGRMLAQVVLAGVLILIAAFGLFKWELARGAGLEAARTVALNTVAMIQAFYLINCRSLRHSILSIGLLRNRWLWLGIAGVLLLQAAITYLPFLKSIFQTAPIGWDEWLRILAAGTIAVALIEAQKAVRVTPA